MALFVNKTIKDRSGDRVKKKIRREEKKKVLKGKNEKQRRGCYLFEYGEGTGRAFGKKKKKNKVIRTYSPARGSPECSSSKSNLLFSFSRQRNSEGLSKTGKKGGNGKLLSVDYNGTGRGSLMERYQNHHMIRKGD